LAVRLLGCLATGIEKGEIMAIPDARKLDMAAAWNEAMALLRQHQALLIPIAGVFLFLPALAVGILMPMPEPTPGADANQIIAQMRPYIMATLPFQLLVIVAGTIGQIACTHMLLGPPGTSVGGAIRLGLLMLPGVLIASLASGMAMGIGLLIFIVPGLYIYARLSMLVPYAAATGTANPINLIKGSWTMTGDSAWSLLGYLILILVVGFIAMVIVSSITGVVLALLMPANFANLLSLVVDGISSAIFSLVMLAAIAAAYRQLSDIGDANDFA
jgi:hypothetical protein